jgi:hypothetical protein
MLKFALLFIYIRMKSKNTIKFKHISLENEKVILICVATNEEGDEQAVYLTKDQEILVTDLKKFNKLICGNT